MPRILGQKKIRKEDSLCNSMTINEFFNRYPSLPNFLLSQLTLKSTELVHPSLVPLLALFSRMSLASSDISNENLNTIKNFKSAFKDTFSSSVANVRRLAAKAYTNFTRKEEIVSEVQQYTNEICSNAKTLSNYLDACLHCIKQMVVTLKMEYVDEFSANKSQLENTLVKLTTFLSNSECYIHRFQLLDIWKNIDTSNSICQNLMIGLDLTTKRTQEIAPGFKDYWIEIDSMRKCETSLNQDISKLDSSESCRHYVANLNSSGVTNNKEVCQSIQIFLEQFINSAFVNGKIIEQCNEILLQNQIVIQEDSELSMDILQTSKHNEEIALGNLGVIAKTTTLMVQAVCFTSMMTKNDFSMFFSDESIYVSYFSEMADEIEFMAQPKNMETCRIHAAHCFKYLLPVLSMRNIATDFDQLVIYAFTKICNSAFTLLCDEDTYIRGLVTEYISKIKSNAGHRYPRDISTTMAVEKLTLYGLEQFGSCLEWFLPVKETLFHPWAFAQSKSNSATPVEILQKIGVREYLFESGDGINVYIEDAYNNITYSNVITTWLSDKSVQYLKSMNLNINIGTVIKQLDSIIDYVAKNHELSGFSSVLWTEKGFLMMVRYYNLLSIIRQYPSVIRYESGESLREDQMNAITSHMQYIESQLTLYLKIK